MTSASSMLDAMKRLRPGQQPSKEPRGFCGATTGDLNCESGPGAVLTLCKSLHMYGISLYCPHAPRFNEIL